MVFSLIAHDYHDALERRLACRDRHLERLQSLARDGKFLGGGVLLDDAGTMIGSNVHLDFHDRAELERWLADEPYVVERVWERVEIRPIKLLELTRG